jgi:hypothetical protein
MSEKPEKEFEDEEPDELEDAEETLDVDKLMRDFDTRKRRGARVAGEPAWRKLERKLEERRTKGLLSDFEDYPVDEPDTGDGSAAKKPRRAASRRQ